MSYQRRITIFGLAIFVAVALLTAYIFVYQFEPFPAVTDLLTNLLIIITASLTFSGTLLILLHYHPTDKPFSIWLHFTFGVGLWLLGEIAWAWYALNLDAWGLEQVPTPGIPDLFYILGMFMFSVGLRRQYQLVNRRPLPVWMFAGFWLFSFLATALILLTFSSFTLENFTEYFYAVSEFLIGLSALYMLLSFSGGVFARPWLGMFIFGISDALFAIANASGLYDYSSSNGGNILTLVVDLSYLVAYLALALGFFAQLLLMKYGPGAFLKPPKQ